MIHQQTVPLGVGDRVSRGNRVFDRVTKGINLYRIRLISIAKQPAVRVRREHAGDAAENGSSTGLSHLRWRCGQFRIRRALRLDLRVSQSIASFFGQPAIGLISGPSGLPRVPRSIRLPIQAFDPGTSRSVRSMHKQELLGIHQRPEQVLIKLVRRRRLAQVLDTVIHFGGSRLTTEGRQVQLRDHLGGLAFFC